MPDPGVEGPEPRKGGSGAWLTLFAVCIVATLVLVAWGLMRDLLVLLLAAAPFLMLAVFAWRRIRPLRP